MEEAVLINDFGRGLRILVVPFHIVIAPVTHFTLYTYRAFFSGFRIDNHDFGMFKIMSYSIATHIEWVVNA